MCELCRAGAVEGNGVVDVCSPCDVQPVSIGRVSVSSAPFCFRLKKSTDKFYWKVSFLSSRESLVEAEDLWSVVR